MSSTDSPFNNGQGNDYLFAGNMVYTVSILFVISVRVLCYYIVFLFLPFGMQICTVCVHISSVPLPRGSKESPVNLVSSSQSVSSPHSSIPSLYSLLHSRYHFTP